MSNFLDYFYELCKIPRVSGNETAVIKWIEKLLNQNKIKTFIDKKGNLYAYKNPNSKKSPVLVQAHVDMVGVKDDNSKHDFKKDPIPYFIKNGWIMTKGTTLGADDGAGVAIMLGLLLDKKDDSSIEALFTVEEETTLGGANAALPGKFKSKYLINIDNIDDTDIVIGSASTSDYTITLPITRKANKDKTYSLKVFGGTSGHSGGDIHKTISNVAIDTCSILFDLAKKYQFNIININSGMAKNSIPSSIEIIFTLKDSIEQFKNEFTLLFEEYKKPYHVFEKNLTFELKTTKSSSKPFDSKSSKKLLDLIVASTNGMNRYDHDLNLTIASNNLGMIKTSEKDVNLSFLNRSSFSFFDKYLRNKVETLANLAGAKFTPNQYSVGAPAYIDNPLAKVVAKIAKTKFKHQTKILAIHAGLEFGLISRNYPGMNYISVGPNIKGEHTVNEMMEIKSFEYVYKLIKETIKELN